MESEAPYYRHDLAHVHDRGYGFHADACAPGILTLLDPVRQRGGLVLEIGCGSGLLTRHLRSLVLPDDPIPAADAIVG